MKTAIKAVALSKTYAGHAQKVLDGVDLEIQEGEIFGVVGPNGAGKTTLFGCLLGLLKHEGELNVGGASPALPQTRAHFGYVPERLTFEHWMKGRQFVSFHHALAGKASLNRNNEVESILQDVGIPQDHWDRAVAKYSRGNLQRLALAQALVAQPLYLFLDEPTSGMDPLGVRWFKDLVRREAERGCTVVLNSHQLPQVEDLCGRVAILNKGRIVETKILKGRWAGRKAYVLQFTSAKRAALEKIAKAHPGSQIDIEAGKAKLLLATDKEAAQVLAALVKAGIGVVQAHWQREDLEDAVVRAAEGGR